MAPSSPWFATTPAYLAAACCRGPVTVEGIQPEGGVPQGSCGPRQAPVCCCHTAPMSIACSAVRPNTKSGGPGDGPQSSTTCKTLGAPALQAVSKPCSARATKTAAQARIHVLAGPHGAALYTLKPHVHTHRGRRCVPACPRGLMGVSPAPPALCNSCATLRRLMYNPREATHDHPGGLSCPTMSPPPGLALPCPAVSQLG